MRYTGKTAIITGASRGIGAAVAKRLALEGSNVVLAARSVNDLEAVRDEITELGGAAVAVETDAADPDQLERLVGAATSTFGPVNVLVNNAGVLPPAARSQDISLAEWDRVLRLNLTAPWLLANLCRPVMATVGGGVVINVTSTAAFYPSVGLASYNASKAALTMVSKVLALEWARDGIRVIAVAPGKVDTALVQPVLDFSERKGLRLNPLGRVATTEELAELVAYLASDGASYITGSVITFDGGEVAATGADQGR
jgi:NAD(P)-dependent dehydrogenase (short-subunit alcohol dehydrogenase family)